MARNKKLKRAALAEAAGGEPAKVKAIAPPPAAKRPEPVAPPVVVEKVKEPEPAPPPVVEKVKRSKVRYVRPAKEVREASPATPLPARSTKLAGRLMTKNLALPPKEDRAGDAIIGKK